MIDTIKDLSGEDSCNAMRGTYESLTWFYHSSNRDCHRNTQRARITGAIEEFFRHNDINEFRDTHCSRFDQGGSLDGWLKLGPTASFPSNPYCDGRDEL
ncbi:hypothetical protein N7493_000898 [Penicillium malachiteum]|uniref:Secreted protein CSS2 C-terminal domain-containing protein n=1 Tax=Penicillium malachiteum TaxID=1324776 RepID=A0AAD6N1A3_9EURO|nr:hypothetical protein N7493_000898 [Penicillium malachiteum]